MITRVEALGYRCLQYVDQPLGPFHVLVGPNASGKTTFLDVIAFLGRLVSDGAEKAVGERSQNFYDLVWQRAGSSFELAVEARFPEFLRGQGFDTVRYEVVVYMGPAVKIVERLLLLTGAPPRLSPRRTFPQTSLPPRTLLLRKNLRAHVAIARNASGEAQFLPETKVIYPFPPIKLAPQRSALGNVPADESLFPVSTWFRDLLTTGVQPFVLNSQLIRKASPPGQEEGFKSDGSNLPWVIADLEKQAPERLQQWVAHLQTALPDLEAIKTIERPEDRHRYLVVRYRGGVDIPSWMVSDGTLRMLALTLPAYLPDFSGVYLIEEPENGIHPRAIETVFQSLSSVYNAQILLATHSPVILNLVDPEQVLCFAKSEDGATDIVRGSEHPALSEWKRQTTLGVLFAAGVLG